MNNELSKLPERLKKLRKEHNLTQAQLAEKLNIETKTYGKYEQGTSRISNETIVAISELYGTTTDYILTGKYKNPHISSINEAIKGIDENSKYILLNLFKVIEAELKN